MNGPNVKTGATATIVHQLANRDAYTAPPPPRESLQAYNGALTR